MWRWLFLILSVCFLPALAQDDDRDFLTAFLEDNLSGAGRQVKITGFAGALSSRATIEEMTIADDDGIWITLKGVTLDWSRAALLSGRIEVETLSAREIDLPRLPAAGNAPPSPEASAFALPELPVSVDIGTLRIDRARLGAPLLGQEATLSLLGRAALSGGEGEAGLSAERLDGPGGTLTLKGSYSNARRQLALDLALREPAAGLFATLAGLPGAPAVEFTATGEGPIDDYGLTIRLATDGAERLTGNVAVSGDADGRRFRADIGGDIAPVFAPDYRDFFGPELRLAASGRRDASGALTLEAFDLTAQSLALSGSAQIAPGGIPTAFDLTGRMAAKDGTPLPLPVPGGGVEIGSADLKLAFDAAQDDGWTADIALNGLATETLTAGTLSLRGSGRIAQPGAGRKAAIGGTLRFDATALKPSDTALAGALGDTAEGNAVFHWQEGGALNLPVLNMSGVDYGLSGGLKLGKDGAETRLAGRATVQASDLSRFSGLVGRPVGGAGKALITGRYAPLSGGFDIDLALTGRDLTLAQPEADRLLKGQSTLNLSAARGKDGTEIRRLSIRASTLSADASGWLRSNGSDVQATARFADLSALGPRYRGSLDAAFAFSGDLAGAAQASLRGTGQNLAIGQAETDRLLRGTTTLDVALDMEGRQGKIRHATLENPQLRLSAKGDVQGRTRQIDLEGRLADLALLVPDYSGPVTMSGRVVDDGAAYTLDMRGTGPGGLEAQAKGTVAADFATADLALAGRAEAALANPFLAPRSIQGPVRFDLTMKGKPAPASFAGRVSMAGGRFSAPLIGLALENLDAVVDLNGGRAQLNVEAAPRTGGRVAVAGPVTLTAPYPADLAITLAEASFRDKRLYDTAVSGALSLRGPLRGGGAIAGSLTLSRTEIKVPSTGLGASGAIGAIQHRNEPANVRRTRANAGLIAEASGDSRGGGGGFSLDVTLNAPNRIFIRGRGLDAEMGGRLRLAGTTNDIRPEGGLDLIRGRLDILGKRFSLDEGRLRVQGKPIPYIRLVAESDSGEVTARIIIEGDADAPDVRFESVPELPEEEVLSHLLFGRSLTSLSPFQAAQLASAVATLAGKGGEGIVSKLRRGAGLDDLDITSDDEGNAALKAGKYLSENIYSDVTVDSSGKTEIQLNLDVSKSVTVRGRANSDGETGLGIFVEKDY
ncbi:MAG: translocation/assembly module TamB domain-containing protein [Paracoccaceae bacterium]